MEIQSKRAYRLALLMGVSLDVMGNEHWHVQRCQRTRYEFWGSAARRIDPTTSPVTTCTFVGATSLIDDNNRSSSLDARRAASAIALFPCDAKRSSTRSSATT